MSWVVLTRDLSDAGLELGQTDSDGHGASADSDLNNAIVKLAFQNQGCWPPPECFTFSHPFTKRLVILRVLCYDGSATPNPFNWSAINVVYVLPEMVLRRPVSVVAAEVLRRDDSVPTLRQALRWQDEQRPTPPVVLVECAGPSVYVHDALCWMSETGTVSIENSLRLLLRLNASLWWSQASASSEFPDWLVRLLNQPAIQSCGTVFVVDDIDLLVEQDAFSGAAPILERLRDETTTPLLLVRQRENDHPPPPVIHSLLGEQGICVELSPPFRSLVEARAFRADVLRSIGPDLQTDENDRWLTQALSPAAMLYARPMPRPSAEQCPIRSKKISHLAPLDQSYVVPPAGWRSLYRLIAFMNTWVAEKAVTCGGRPTGAVLFGPPGCGKTALIRQIAVGTASPETCFDFLSTADLSRPIIGESERILSKLFREGHGRPKLRVLVIDEADALFPGRHIPDTGLVRLGGALLECLDELRHSANRLLVFLATNRPWRLDKSLFLGDKLDAFLYLGPPNAVYRARVLERIGLLPKQDSEAAALISRTDGFTFADLASIPGRMQRFAKLATAVVADMQPSVTREELLRFERWNAKLRAHGVTLCEASLYDSSSQHATTLQPQQ